MPGPYTIDADITAGDPLHVEHHEALAAALNEAASAATANVLVLRDSFGRIQVATPSVAADAATKGYVDTAVAGVPGASDATTSAKGIVQLAGDLGGTAAAPTVVASSTTVSGKVELATTAETTTGTDTVRAVTPAGVQATRGLYVGTNAQTGTSYTPVLTDQGKLVTLNNAAAISVSLPQDSAVAFPVGSWIDFLVIGAGSATFAAGTGATVNGAALTATQWRRAIAIKRAANTWTVDIAPTGGSGIPATTVDAKGDLIAATANDTVARLAVGTNGQVLTADSAEATGLKWATPAAGGGAIASPVLPKYGAVGSYLRGFQGSVGTGNIGAWTDTMVAFPMVWADSFTADRVVVSVTTAVAGSTIELSVYANSGTTYRPGSLISILGTVNSATTGEKELTISFPFTAGTIYWFAYNVHGAGPVGMNTFAVDLYNYLTTNTTEGFNNTSRNGAEGSLGGTTGAAPATFPGSGYGGAAIAVLFRRGT